MTIQPLRSAACASDSWYGYPDVLRSVVRLEYYYTLWVFVQNNGFRAQRSPTLRHRSSPRARSLSWLNDRTHLRHPEGPHHQIASSITIGSSAKPVAMSSPNHGRSVFSAANVPDRRRCLGARDFPSPARRQSGERRRCAAERCARRSDSVDAAKRAMVLHGSNARSADGNPAAVPQFPGRSKFVRAPGVNGPPTARRAIVKGPRLFSPAARCPTAAIARRRRPGLAQLRSRASGRCPAQCAVYGEDPVIARRASAELFPLCGWNRRTAAATSMPSGFVGAPPASGSLCRGHATFLLRRRSLRAGARLRAREDFASPRRAAAPPATPGGALPAPACSPGSGARRVAAGRDAAP